MAARHLSSIAAAMLVTLDAQAYVITDQYIGSQDHGYGDVIGEPAKFDISRLTYSRTSENGLQVRIYTPFVNHIGVYPAADAAGLNRGIGLGDLLLADDWSPIGSAADGYVNDNYTDHYNSTHWDWGLALDDRYSTTSGAVTLYKLAGPNLYTLQSSNDFIGSGYTFRDGQAVAVNTTSNYNTSYGTRGRWFVNNTWGYIQFDLDLAGTSLLQGDSLAFHWGMTCGNDVIEGRGAVPVPEPATLGLLGLALAGMVQRRRARKRPA